MDETESVAAAVNGAEACYTGVVPAGTPVCDESEQILLGDRFGLQTGVMKAFATVWDGQPADASEHQLQTVGYLYTPQPLSAGTYVLCETKAPAGYARSKSSGAGDLFGSDYLLSEWRTGQPGDFCNL